MFGATPAVQQQGTCYSCHQQKQGQEKRPVSGGGWGSTRREATVATCINPNCTVGQQNLASQSE